MARPTGGRSPSAARAHPQRAGRSLPCRLDRPRCKPVGADRSRARPDLNSSNDIGSQREEPRVSTDQWPGASGDGLDDQLTQALVRTRRFFTKAEVSKDLRTLHRSGGREADAFYLSLIHISEPTR